MERAFWVCSPRCWWKRSLKLPFSPTPSHQTYPGKASIPTAFSCRGLAVMQSLKQLLLLVLQVPNPNPIYWPGWTPSCGRINLPELFPRSSGPVTGNLNYHLSQQVSSPYTLLVHAQLQRWPGPSCRKRRITAGKASIPNQSKDT